MSTMASQITSVSIVCSTVVCSGEDQRKHQSSASLAFVRGIHRWPVNSPHKGPEMRKMLPFGDVIMKGARWQHIQSNIVKGGSVEKHPNSHCKNSLISYAHNHVFRSIQIILQFYSPAQRHTCSFSSYYRKLTSLTCLWCNLCFGIRIFRRLSSLRLCKGLIGYRIRVTE